MQIQDGASLDFGSFGTTDPIPAGEYDGTITAFDGGRAKWGDNPPMLTYQITVDNGEHKGKSLSADIFLTYQGDLDDRAFATINTLTTKAGFPTAGFKYRANPKEFAEQFQQVLAEQGDERFRLRFRVGYEYKIDGQYKPDPSSGQKYWNADDYERAVEEGGDAQRFPKIIPQFSRPEADAEIAPAPTLPASLGNPADPLDASFGPQDPMTTTADTTPTQEDGPAPF